MASFGEALVSAFNSTYSTVMRGMMQAEAIAESRDQRARQQRHRDQTAANMRDAGLLPGGQGGESTPAVAPVQVPTGDAGGAAGGAAGAAAAGAGQNFATGVQQGQQTGQQVGNALGAVGRAAFGAPGGETGGEQGAAPPPEAPAMAPPAETPVAPPSPAPAQGAVQGTTPTAPAPQQPVISPQAFQEAVRRVGNDPVNAMIVAPFAVSPQQRQPGGTGEREAAARAPQLLREIAATRPEGQTGPIVRADWDRFFRNEMINIMQNLSPQEQAVAFANIERIRTAGMRQAAGLAVAAAQAGDAEGAARALGVMSQFVPDGYRTSFRVQGNGLVMTRAREDGRGEATTVPVTLDQVQRYAVSALDPLWSLNHFLNVEKHNEQVRHNRVNEGLRAGELAVRRAERAEREDERRRLQETDANVARAQRQLERAQAEYDALSRAETREPGALAQARLAVERASDAYDTAIERGGLRGLQVAGGLDERAAARRAQRERAEGRGPLTEQEYTRIDRVSEALPNDDAGNWARANLPEAVMRNRGEDFGTLGNALMNFFRNAPPHLRENPPSTITYQGRTISLRPPRREAPETPAPARVAPTDGPASMGGARTPPARSGSILGAVQSSIATQVPVPPPTREERQALQEQRQQQQIERQRQARSAYESELIAVLQRHNVQRVEQLPPRERNRLFQLHYRALTPEERRFMAR